MAAMAASDRAASPVPLDELGEHLAPLRLCDPAAVEAMQLALGRHGQLTPLVAFEADGSLEILDGFKRLQAARRLDWKTLCVQRCSVDPVMAIVQIGVLHSGRGLTELEEGWLVRALYRDHGLSQPAIAERLGRHKSWVCRRLLLVEALHDEVQARLRLGLLAPRAAVALAALPRGNQLAASEVVTRRGFTVRQTELFVGQLLESTSDAARAALVARWATGELCPAKPGPAPARAVRSEADWLAADLATLHRVAARVQARLLGTPLLAFGPVVAELLEENLLRLVPVLAALNGTIATTTTPGGRIAPSSEERAA